MKRFLQFTILVVMLGGLSVFCLTPASASQEDKNKPAMAETKPATDKTKAETSIDVRELFLGKCATCHGKDGRAHTFKGRLRRAQDLTDQAWQDSVTNQRVADTITVGKGSLMPAFGKKLSVDEIEALAGYVRQLKK